MDSRQSHEECDGFHDDDQSKKLYQNPEIGRFSKFSTLLKLHTQVRNMTTIVGMEGKTIDSGQQLFDSLKTAEGQLRDFTKLMKKEKDYPDFLLLKEKDFEAKCQLCAKWLTNDDSVLVKVGECGHSYHTGCVYHFYEKMGGLEEVDMLCCICHGKMNHNEAEAVYELVENDFQKHEKYIKQAALSDQMGKAGKYLGKYHMILKFATPFIELFVCYISQAKVLLEMSAAAISLNLRRESLSFLKRAEQILLQKADRRPKALVRNEVWYSAVGLTEDSLFFSKESLLAQTYVCMNTIFRKDVTRSKQSSLEFAKKLMESRDEYRNKILKAQTNVNKGLDLYSSLTASLSGLFSDLGELDNHLVNVLMFLVIVIMDEREFDYKTCVQLSQIEELFSNSKQYEEALKFHKAMFKFNQKIFSPLMKPCYITCYKSGMCSFFVKDFSEACHWLQKAIDILSKTDYGAKFRLPINHGDVFRAILYLGDAYLFESKVGRAVKNWKLALNYAKTNLFNFQSIKKSLEFRIHNVKEGQLGQMQKVYKEMHKCDFEFTSVDIGIKILNVEQKRMIIDEWKWLIEPKYPKKLRNKEILQVVRSLLDGKTIKRIMKNLEQKKRCKFCCLRFKKLLRCGRCKNVYYCSASCQKKNWASHKPSCKKH